MPTISERCNTVFGKDTSGMLKAQWKQMNENDNLTIANKINHFDDLSSDDCIVLAAKLLDKTVTLALDLNGSKPQSEQDTLRQQLDAIYSNETGCFNPSAMNFLLRQLNTHHQSRTWHPGILSYCKGDYKECVRLATLADQLMTHYQQLVNAPSARAMAC